MRNLLQESESTIAKSRQELVWDYCALSKRKLELDQVVSDYQGLLFNKEAVLRGLINKDIPKQFQHIKSIHDIVELHIPGKEIKKDSESYSYIVPCGDIHRTKLLKEVIKTGNLQCPKCNGTFDKDNVIEIGSNSAATRLNNLQSLGLHHDLHKIKRSKRDPDTRRAKKPRKD